MEKKKIFWTFTEKQEILKEACNHYMTTRDNALNCLNAAQNKVIKKERIRNICSLSFVPWFERGFNEFVRQNTPVRNEVNISNLDKNINAKKNLIPTDITVLFKLLEEAIVDLVNKKVEEKLSEIKDDIIAETKLNNNISGNFTASFINQMVPINDKVDKERARQNFSTWG